MSHPSVIEHHKPRLIGPVMLGTRLTAAVLIERHPDQVRRRCRPVACDVSTRAALYDLDEAARIFADTPRRFVPLTSRVS